MYRTILLPLDGSALAERALPYARTLAQASGARLLLLQAVQSSATPPPDGPRDQAHALHDARAYLAGVAAQRGERTVVETVVFPGGAAEAILEETRVRAVDLIVMSIHGRAGPQRPLDGGVADQVVQRVEVPVLLIPAAAVRPWPQGRPLRIVAPLDVCSGDDDVLTCLDELAVVLGAELLLLRVVAPLDVPGARVSPSPAPARATTPRDLETIAAGLRAAGRTVAIRVAVGDAVTTIATIAREQAADVIALSADRSGSPPHLAMGGIVSGLMRRARLPLLLIRPDAGQRAARPPDGPVRA